ncbi:hypothetical protein ABH892_000680 [Paenibacillus sp. RC254]
MEFKKIFESLLEENNPRKSYSMLETLILKILNRYYRIKTKN